MNGEYVVNSFLQNEASGKMAVLVQLYGHESESHHIQNECCASIHVFSGKTWLQHSEDISYNDNMPKPFEILLRSSSGLSIRSLDRPLFIVFGQNSEGIIVIS